MLKDVTVLDLTTSIAGPYAAMLLSDFGASVIKLERLTGDDVRFWGPPFLSGESLWFLSVNRNKRSVCLDYASKPGRVVLEDLLDRVDVVITNQLAEAQEKLGIDAETVRAGRPQLIHVSLTGFGLTGSKSSLPCYDLIAEGYSGVMDLTGPPDAEPQKIGTPAADLLAGSDATMAILAALYRRCTSGLGCAIDVSLTESMIRFLTPRIVPFLSSGHLPRRSGGRDSVIAIYQTFDTADLPMTLALGNDAIWRRFWEVAERPDLAEGDGLSSNADRLARRAEIVARIQEILITRPRQDWLERFEAARVPAGPIYSLDEMVADDHFNERLLFFEIERDDQSIPQVALGIHVDGAASGYASAPPQLGEHTEEVLRDVLGYNQNQIEQLLAADIVRAPRREPAQLITEEDYGIRHHSL